MTKPTQAAQKLGWQVFHHKGVLVVIPFQKSKASVATTACCEFIPINGISVRESAVIITSMEYSAGNKPFQAHYRVICHILVAVTA
jgi:hypothetical protein